MNTGVSCNCSCQLNSRDLWWIPVFVFDISGIADVAYDIVLFAQLVPKDQIVLLCQIVISIPMAYLCYGTFGVDTKSTVERVHEDLVAISHSFITG